MTEFEPGVRAASQELVEELMGTVVAVDWVLCTLMDLPADALPGENRSEALREALTASACPEVSAVGEDACRAAIALIAAVVDRIGDDAHAASELARASELPPC